MPSELETTHLIGAPLSSVNALAVVTTKRANGSRFLGLKNLHCRSAALG